MDYSHFSILLLLLSLGLLAAEVFVPSGGFISVLMLLSLAGSVFCAYNAWWEASPVAWWSYIASVVLLLPSVLIAAFVVFPRTRYGQRILLVAPDPDEIVGYAKEQEELQQLIGQKGKTITMHGPGGMVLVGDRRYHSETRGMLLDPGEEVEVVGIKGNRLVIRLVDVPPHASGSDVSTDETAVAQEEPARGATVAGDRTGLPSSETGRLPDDSTSAAPLDPFVGEDRNDASAPRDLA